jgi:hypothetical protein
VLLIAWFKATFLSSITRRFFLQSVQKLVGNCLLYFYRKTHWKILASSSPANLDGCFVASLSNPEANLVLVIRKNSLYHHLCPQLEWAATSVVKSKVLLSTLMMSHRPNINAVGRDLGVSPLKGYTYY